MHATDYTNVLQKFPLLAPLSPAELSLLADHAEWRSAPKHTLLYLADQPSSFVGLLLRGSVKLGIYAADGREIIKCIQHPYSLFGESVLAGESRRSEFAGAMNQEVEYLSVPTAIMRHCLDRNPAFAQGLLLHLGDRLRRAERQWESLLLKDVRARIVEFLKESAGARGRRVGFETLVKHDLTQQDIANLVGASRQTVTAVLNELRKSNLIHFNRNVILIRDVEKL